MDELYTGNTGYIVIKHRRKPETRQNRPVKMEKGLVFFNSAAAPCPLLKEDSLKIF